jgi:hypothetical protein
MEIVMGAGCTTDHYNQDAAEAYIVYKLQQLAVKNGVGITDDVAEKQKNFTEYCVKRNIVNDFNNSVYKENVDAVLSNFFSDICKKFPNKKFDIVDVEKAFRDEKRKGDFIIKFENGSYKSISLKNYKNGFSRIQLCSGTWHSFINNFLFESDGVGSFINPFTQEKFQGSNRNKRNELIKALGYTALNSVYKFFDDVQDTIKEQYTYGEDALFWKDISSKWKNDCVELGIKATNIVVKSLDKLPKDVVKNRIIHMAGLNYDEELLLIGGGKYLCSLTNDKYATLLKRVNSENCAVRYTTVKKSVAFTLYDADGVIVRIDVPFTLQKNGAWHLPKIKYTGKQYHEKEGVKLAYGERRPKKSKEIATSINTYLDLKKAGVCQ